MAIKYDVEDLLADIQGLMADNLNTKIAAVDADKSSSLSLKTVNASAYFLQTLNDKATNYDPFIIYGVDDVEADGRGPCTIERIKMSVVLVLADNGQDINIAKRMFRYRRALLEIFQDNWFLVNNSIKLRVAPSIPVPLTQINSDHRFQAVGLMIDADLA